MSVRIMLVDDHRMFREALRGQLAAEPGFEIVAEAGSGEEALQVAAEAAPDVVILDIGLPGISGIDVARQLVRAYPDVGIVALSGYADRVFVEEMMKAGSRGYVVKSAGADELVAADEYERLASYERITVTLASGKQAWVYIHVQSARPTT